MPTTKPAIAPLCNPPLGAVFGAAAIELELARGGRVPVIDAFEALVVWPPPPRCEVPVVLDALAVPVALFVICESGRDIEVCTKKEDGLPSGGVFGTVGETETRV